MKDRPIVELWTSASAADALKIIVVATEREELPFISASRYPQQTEKLFVSKIDRSRFRIWKVPSSTRSRQNVCVPYLRGTVEDSNGGAVLRGSFALHPFNKLMAFLPLAILVLIWIWTDKTTGALTFLAAATAVLFIFELVMVKGCGRLKQKEEMDIVDFLQNLLPNARSSST